MESNKRILGLDIGTTSIGWAIVEATNKKRIDPKNGKEIDTQTDINNDRIGILQKDGKAAVGVRIIKQDTASKQQFEKGLKLNTTSSSTPTATRRIKRGSRRLKSRYKLRRQKLTQVLEFLGMIPDNSFYTKDKTAKRKGNFAIEDIGEAIYELRDRAIKEKITLAEWGRIMLHMNQWRGYSSDRFAKADAEELSAKNDFYTSVVKDIIELEPKIKKGTNGKPDFIEQFLFEIYFENGDIGINKVKWSTDAKTMFTKNKPHTYKKKINENGSVDLSWSKVKEDDYAYKKWKINDSLSTYCSSNSTVGSYFYQNFYVNKSENLKRIRTNIVNRDWYEKEFDKIFELQFENHKAYFEKYNIDDIVKAVFKEEYIDGSKNAFSKEVITRVNKHQIETAEVDENGNKKKREATKGEKIKYLIKDLIIYYQRPWQQAKNKRECTFEYIPDVILNPDFKEGVSDKKDKYILNTKNPTKKVTDKDGKVHFLRGRTVIPRSHPLHQEFKIWNQINNVKLNYTEINKPSINLFEDSVKFKETVGKSVEEVKNLLFKKLQETKSTTWYSFVKKELNLPNVCDEVEELGTRKKSKAKNKTATNVETGEVFEEYFTVNYRKRKKDGTYDDIKLKGNTTLKCIDDILKKENKEWYNEIWKTSKDRHKPDTKPNVNKGEFKQCEYKVTNLQILWEIIYDININDTNKVSELIQKKFPEILKEKVELLSKIKFDDAGMGQLSTKAIKNIMPLMSNGNNITTKVAEKIKSLIKTNEEEKEKSSEEKLSGLKDFFRDTKTRLELAAKRAVGDFTYLNYTEASAVIYGSHSSKSIEGNFEAIETVRQHSMNNPVVEKIVNETIRIVNDIYKEYGFDEVRIELSRELKASPDERVQMNEGMKKGYEKNEWAKEMLREINVVLKKQNENTNHLNTTVSSSNIDKIKIMDDIANNYYNFRLKEEKEKPLTEKEKQPTKKEIEKYLLWIEQMHRCPYTNETIPLTDVFHKDKIVQIEHIIPRERYPNNSFSNKVLTWSTINSDKAALIAYEYIVSKRNSSISEINLPIESTKSKSKVKLVAAENWQNHIENLFPKGAKRNNLLRKQIPQDFIEQQLKDTQYINKKLKEKIAEIVGSDKVHTTTGQVTDILRESWHLNKVIQDLTKNRFENFTVTKLKPLFDIAYTRLEEFKTELEEILENEDKPNEYKRLIETEKSVNIQSLQSVTNIHNSIDSFITGLLKLTKDTTFKYSEENIEFSITGKEKIEQVALELKNAVSNNTSPFKLIIEPEKVFYTNDIDEINEILVDIEIHINDCEEKGKKTTYKYSRSADVNLITEKIDENNKPIQQLNGFNKRIDHRHHAVDAFIIACTKQWHIQYLNLMNQINTADQDDEKEKLEKRKWLKEEVCRVSKQGDLQANKFQYPWNDYNQSLIYESLSNILVVNKNTNVLLSPSSNKRNTSNTKAVSIRGELHDETLYAKKKFVDLTDKGKRKIEALIKDILIAKQKQQIEGVFKNGFKEIITDTIVIVDYQYRMISFLDELNDVDFTSDDTSLDGYITELKKILKKNSPFLNKQGEKLSWLRIYQKKDKAVRPNGLAMNLNIVKDGIKNIADVRIKRIAEYRIAYLKECNQNIDDSTIPKEEKIDKKQKINNLPLYANALYEVIIPTAKTKYVEIKDLTLEMLEKIDYGNKVKNDKVIHAINERGLENYKNAYWTNPICLSSNLIPIKKVRERSFYNNLVEIRPKTFVMPSGSYLTFVSNNKGIYDLKIIKFLEAVQYLQKSKTKLDATSFSKLANIDINEVAYTLQSGDIIYLHSEDLPSPLNDNEKNDFNSIPINELIKNLYIVKDMNPSQGKIIFSKINTASEIKLNKNDVNSIFNNQYDTAFTEEIKYGTKEMLQRCIKVFTNRLGTRIVPYWKFPNGCWDKEVAEKLGLINKKQND